MHVVLTGSPGAPLADLAYHLSVHDRSLPVDVGGLLRAEVDLGTPLGQAVADAMARGDLAADRPVLELVERHLRGSRERGFILAGFPRTIPQAVLLDLMLKHLDLPLDLVAAWTPPAPAPEAAPTPAVQARLRTFQERGLPMLGHYQRKGLLLTVREGDPRAAAEAILGAVAARGRVVME